jgi:hypothetical protein
MTHIQNPSGDVFWLRSPEAAGCQKEKELMDSFWADPDMRLGPPQRKFWHLPHSLEEQRSKSGHSKFNKETMQSLAPILASNAWQMNMPSTPAPEYDGVDFPADVTLNFTASPSELLAEVWAFFCEGDTPTEVAKPLADKPWTLQAAVFSDYVEVQIEVQILQNKGSPSSSIVRFCDMTKSDVVGFHRLVDKFVKHATLQDFTISKGTGAESQGRIYCDDDFDDFEFENDMEVDWQQRVESVLALLEDSASDSRVKAARMIARWTEKYAESRFVFAEAFSTRPELVMGLFQAVKTTPLAALYPISAAFKFICSCPESAAMLHGPFLLVLRTASTQDAPKLAMQEITLACQALGKSVFIGSPPIVDMLSTASTRFTHSSLSCFGSNSGDDVASAISTSPERAAWNTWGQDSNLETVWNAKVPTQVETLCSISSDLWV